MKKLLTIGIPAYNRPKTLFKILQVISKYPINECEILVSDDSTNNLVKKLVEKQKIKNLRYFKNNKNLGFSENVRQIYKFSNGRYLWLICDDDILFDNSYNIIRDKIKKHNPEIIYFNAIRKTIFGVDKKMSSGELEINNRDSQFYENFWKGVYLSIIVFNKNKFVKKKILKLNVKTNVFIQLTIVLLTLSKKIKFVMCNKVIVRRVPGRIYGDFSRFMITDAIDAIKKTKHSFSNRKLLKVFSKQFSAWLLTYAASKIDLISYSSFNRKKGYRYINQFMPIKSKVLFLFFHILDLVPKKILTFLLILLFVFKFGVRGIDKYKKKIKELNADNRDTNFQEYK